MRSFSISRPARRSSAAVILAVTLAAILPLSAESQELQQKLAEVKQASAANKQALAHYTWQEQQTISLKGEVKKQQLFQVTVGPNGQQKVEIGGSQAPPPSGGRLKQRVVAKKTTELKDYGGDIGDLAKQYTQPDPDRLQAAFQAGHVSLQSGGGPGMITLVIKSYIKPNDLVTIVFNEQLKAINSLQIATYLDAPSDVATIAVQFAKLADGTNHVTGTQVDGVSKQLTIVTQNSAYQPV